MFECFLFSFFKIEFSDFDLLFTLLFVQYPRRCSVCMPKKHLISKSNMCTTYVRLNSLANWFVCDHRHQNSLNHSKCNIGCSFYKCENPLKIFASNELFNKVFKILAAAQCICKKLIKVHFKSFDFESRGITSRKNENAKKNNNQQTIWISSGFKHHWAMCENRCLKWFGLCMNFLFFQYSIIVIVWIEFTDSVLFRIESLVALNLLFFFCDFQFFFDV